MIARLADQRMWQAEYRRSSDDSPRTCRQSPSGASPSDGWLAASGPSLPNRAPPAPHARKDLEVFGSASGRCRAVASSGRARDCWPRSGLPGVWTTSCWVSLAHTGSDLWPVEAAHVIVMGMVAWVVVFLVFTFLPLTVVTVSVA